MSFKKSILFLFSTIAVTLSLCAELSITKLNKTSGGTTGFSSIAIYGSGFSKTAQIFFGDQRVILNRWVRDDLIHILTTKYPNEETVDVKIVQGEEEFVLPNAYTFVDKAPTLNSINKSEGLTEGGLSVTLKGVQLTPVSEIKFGDQTVNKYTFLHDRRVVMTSPSSEAGIVDVSYSNALGQASIENGFEYLADTDPRAAPVITSVNRTSILPSGNAKILIRGKNFSTAGQWSVGSFPAEKVIHSHSERVYIHTPVLASEGAITLSYVGNSGTVDLVDAFNVTEKKPNLTNMIPNKGFTESVTLIRLNGKYFTDSMQLFIGEQEAEFFRFDHDGQALFKVQPQSAGVFDLKLVTAYGEQLLPGAFEFADNLPRIDYLWPSTGPIQGATKVIVRGNYFHLNDLVADLNGTIQPIYTHRDTRSFGFLSEAVPQATSVDLTVTTSEGVTTRENAYLYETQHPVIDYIRPLSGPTAGNKFIDIYGVNFTANTNIQLGGQEYSIHRFYNSGRIRIKTLATDAGVTDLSIVNENGSDSFESCYTFIDDAAANAGEPIVSWIKNARSPLTGNTPVIVRGKNFGEELSVTLNGIPVNFTRHSKIDQIKFNTQQELSAVNHDLVLTNEFGSTTIPSAIQFVEEKPIFYSIKENDGYVHGDTFFTVYGRFFTPTIELLIDGTPAKTHRFHNSQSVTFQSPGGSLGTKNLELVSEFGTLTLNDAWNYKGIPPQVTRVNPNIGEAEGGSFVRVYGKFFSPSSVVSFNGVEGTDINVINTRQIKVRVPDNTGNAGGLVDVQVVTEFGTSVLPKGYYYKPSAIVNAAPAITSAAIITATEDVAYSYEVSVLDPDDANDGVNLTWSLSNAPAGMAISNTGIISWLPTEGILTSGEVTVSVADGGEDGAAPATQPFTIVVTPINDAPVITSSAPNTATEDVLYSYQVIVSDPDDLNDGVGISWSLLNAPVGMSISSTGLITWTPGEGVLTSGQVTVIAKDGQEDFADEAEEVFEITVTPVNDAPSITSAPVLTATEDLAYNYAVSVIDPDNSSFSWNLSNAPAGMSISNAGVISWTPVEGVLTSGEVTVSVSDGALSDSQSFTIAVTTVNDSPSITSVAITTATEDTAYSYQVVVSDPDDTEFDFDLSGNPVGMTISESGLITWTPSEGVLTSGEMTVTVADGGEDGAVAATQVFTVTVTPINDSPTITSIAPTTASEDVEYIYTVTVSDSDDENNGTDLSWSITNAPEGMMISNTGSITWTPAEGVLTSEEVTVTVTDGGEDNSEAATQVFIVTVTPVNDSPNITSTAPTTAFEGQEYNYQVVVIDTDDENNGIDLTWSLTNEPVGMIISSTGLVTWTPGSGVSSSGLVTITVADGGEDGAVLAEETFEVSVESLMTLLANDDYVVGASGEQLIFNILENDSPGVNGTIEIDSITDPNNGHFQYLGQGNLSYNPNPGFTGNDSFLYTISDSSNYTDSATIFITIEEEQNTVQLDDFFVGVDNGGSISASVGSKNIIAESSYFTVDGVNYPITATGNVFFVNLSGLGEGVYTYSLFLTFEDGSTFNYSGQLTVDFTPPTLDLALKEAPTDGYVNTLPLEISLNADDALSGIDTEKFLVLVNGVSVSLDFSDTILINSLKQGRNEIKVKVVDNAGGANEQTLEVFFDNVAPLVTEIDFVAGLENKTGLINLHFNEDESGISNVTYSANFFNESKLNTKSNIYQIYTKHLSDENVHHQEITFTLIDKAGNQNIYKYQFNGQGPKNQSKIYQSLVDYEIVRRGLVGFVRSPPSGSCEEFEFEYYHTEVYSASWNYSDDFFTDEGSVSYTWNSDGTFVSYNLNISYGFEGEYTSHSTVENGQIKTVSTEFDYDANEMVSRTSYSRFTRYSENSLTYGAPTYTDSTANYSDEYEQLSIQLSNLSSASDLPKAKAPDHALDEELQYIGARNRAFDFGSLASRAMSRKFGFTAHSNLIAYVVTGYEIDSCGQEDAYIAEGKRYYITGNGEEQFTDLFKLDAPDYEGSHDIIFWRHGAYLLEDTHLSFEKSGIINSAYIYTPVDYDFWEQFYLEGTQYGLDTREASPSFKFRYAPEGWEIDFNTGQMSAVNEDAMSGLALVDFMDPTGFASYGTFPVELDIIEVDIVPDYNRDGIITEDDRGIVNNTNPWRFWINDDDDSSTIQSSGDKPGSNNPDYDNNFVDGMRDLVDFFPLYLDLKGALDVLPSSDYSYYLVHPNDSFNAFETDLEFGGVGPASADKYLKDLYYADVFSTKPVKQITRFNDFELSEQFLNSIKSDPSKGIVLLEGRSNATRPLKLVIIDKSNSNEVLAKEMPVSMKSVEQMYRHKDLRAVLNDNDGAADRLGDPDNFPDDDRADKYFVMVHGYNVDGAASSGLHSEVFKRMFWSGFNGKYIGTSWYGNPITLHNYVAPDYHEAVVNAFKTSEHFKNFVAQLNGSVTICGHSLGNMVISSAIKDHNLVFNKYFALDAAVAKEAYHINAPKPDSMIGFGDSAKDGNNTWLTYKTDYEKLFASEWHTLFPSSDPRSKLTWRGRFSGVGSGNPTMYNFHSSTEDVLQEYEGNALVSANPGRYAWARQEKFKGDRRQIPYLAGGGSYYLGYGFNTLESSYVKTISVQGSEIKYPKPPSELPPMDSVFIEKIKSIPFFVGNPEELFGSNAQQYALVNRDLLLAKGFPSRSLPVGGKGRLDSLSVDKNFDMHELFKTEPFQWPRSSDEWRHSDFKDVAYSHVYSLFEQFVDVGDLK